MNLPGSGRHRRPHWAVSGACWTLLLFADVAVLSVWAALGSLLVAAGCAGGAVLIRRRRVAAGAAEDGSDGVPTDE